MNDGFLPQSLEAEDQDMHTYEVSHEVSHVVQEHLGTKQHCAAQKQRPS